MPVDAPMPEVAPDAGAALKAARTAAGLSVQQVAQRLKLTPRRVAAIEANDHRGFPAMVYMRGYARSYAKLLDMDPAPLLAAYANAAPDASDSTVAPARRTGVGLQRLPWLAVGGGLAALVLLALLALLVWQWPTDGGGSEPLGDATGSVDAEAQLPGEDAPAPAEGVAVEPDDSIAREPGLDDAGARAEGSGAAVPEAVVAEGLPARGRAAEAQTSDHSAGDTGLETRPVADDRLRVRRITPLGDDELWFEFGEDCWVEVFNTEGQILFEDLLLRRESLRLVGSRPFQIRLGYAPGVTLQYNGEPVPLAPHTRNNVASLVLGQ